MVSRRGPGRSSSVRSNRKRRCTSAVTPTSRSSIAIVASAGTVNTGAIDPLDTLADVAAREQVWLHVDAAIGAPARLTERGRALLAGLERADSIAFDLHKWLYVPYECGVAMVRDGAAHRASFDVTPSYLGSLGGGLAKDGFPFSDHGVQLSRGFRALKVWLGLRHAGRDGYVRMIRDDIALAESMYDAAKAHPELETFTLGLSIATFRFVPAGLTLEGAERERYLNDLNSALVTRLQAEGRAFVSNAVINGAYVLRACIVNFRTRQEDADALPDIVVQTGRAIMGEVAKP